MCGIAGLVALPSPPEKVRDDVTAMIERIRHRGPDGGGIASHPDATIGMARLAIVDIENGRQPMYSDDGEIALVYNGEIYNAPAIRAELQARGVGFKSRSDTEVILRLYEQNPADVERHLAGMWAFAIHDRRRKRVVLSRDRFGIKPLFVANGEGSGPLAFASELRAFDRSLAPLAACFQIDHAAAHAMVSWSFVPDTATIYRGVKRLAPGARLTIDLESGARVETRFWELAPSPDAIACGSLDEACALVEPLLRRAVREHLESDVGVATFLSGGIDSSLITLYAAEESNRAIESYSIGFREARFDESPFARQTAETIGVANHVAMLDEATARESVPAALAAYDEPFGDSSSLAAFLLCSHVARRYKVALGGDGGDEAFAGYKKYQVTKLRRPFRAVPAVRDALGRAIHRLPTRTDRTRGWTELLRTLRRLGRGFVGSDAYAYAQLGQVAPLARTAPLMAAPGAAAAFIDAAIARFEAAAGTELQRTLTSDLVSPLPNDMLVKVDRASMAHSLEVRVPFLDHRLVEVGVGLPERFSLGRNGKRVLRELHRRRFGDALAQRKKTGFGVPVETWLRGPFDRACERLFDASRLDQYGVLSSAALGHGRFRAWVQTDPIIVWHAMALAAWCELTLGGGRSSLDEMFE